LSAVVESSTQRGALLDVDPAAIAGFTELTMRALDDHGAVLDQVLLRRRHGARRRPSLLTTPAEWAAGGGGATFAGAAAYAYRHHRTLPSV
jgi:hypothetical protein